MRAPALLLLLAAAGCDGTASWGEAVLEPPLDTEEVVAAVAALPECSAVRERGGLIHWRPLVFCGSAQPVSGCAYPGKDPPLIELTYRSSAWDGPPQSPLVSALAHELCHVCGYIDGPDREAQADACAMRARHLAGR
jgi:hypothetical protein